MVKNFNKLMVSGVVAWGVLASGCGGSDSTTSNPTTDMLSGVAAAGAPLIGQVTVKGALGIPSRLTLRQMARTK